MKIRENAVSPVIGVLLMLVVTIIIAAVVSGFVGGIVTTDSKAPQMSMDAEIINSGFWSSSYFKAVVTGVDNPIKTKDLKIITQWAKSYPNGTLFNGNSTMIPGQLNFHVNYKVNGWSQQDTWYCVCPQGYGPGVGPNSSIFANFWPFEGTGSSVTMNDVWSGKLTNYSWFGNYNLEAGTILFARPFGGRLGGQATGGTQFKVGYGIADGLYNYTYGSDSNGAVFNPYPDSVDQMEAVLGENWNMLRPGDVVNMKIIHIPSGSIIWQKEISVKG